MAEGTVSRVLNFPRTTFSLFWLNWHGHFNVCYCLFILLLLFQYILPYISLCMYDILSVLIKGEWIQSK